MDVNRALQKIDFILKSNTEESDCLIKLIEQYYQEFHENTSEVIEVNFKKREIISFWEILKDDLGKGF